MMPYIWNSLRKGAIGQGIDVDGMGLRSVRLTNVNLVYESQHQVVGEAFRLLLHRHISVNLLCHTYNVRCLFKAPFGLHTDLRDLRLDNCLTYPPLRFVKSSHKEEIKDLVLGTSTIIMDAVRFTVPKRISCNDAEWRLWVGLTWFGLYKELFDDLENMHDREETPMYRNESLRRDKLESSGIFVKCYGCYDGKRSLTLKRKTNDEGMQIQDVDVIVFNPNEPPIGDETPFSYYKDTEFLKGEPYNADAKTTVIDIYGCFKKNYFEDWGMIESSIDPTKFGTARLTPTEQNKLCPDRPWRKNPRNGRNSFLKEVVLAMGTDPYSVSVETFKELPFVVSSYLTVREGTATCPTLLNIHPMPGPGVKSMAAYPTHPFVKKMAEKIIDYFLKHTTNDGVAWP